jgi:hypothetical protein
VCEFILNCVVHFLSILSDFIFILIMSLAVFRNGTAVVHDPEPDQLLHIPTFYFAYTILILEPG